MPRRTDSGPRTPACRCLRTRAHPPPSSRRKTRSRSRNSTAYVHCRTHDDGEVNADVSHHPKFIPDMIALQFEASGASTGAVVYSWIPWLKPRKRDDSRTLQTLTSALQPLSGASHIAHKLQHTHYLALLASVGAAVVLIVLAGILVPVVGAGRTGSAALGVVYALFVLLAVGAGFTGTTMLYSAFVGGEWEKRSLRIIMKTIELELTLIKQRLKESDPRTSGNLAQSSSSSETTTGAAHRGSGSGSARQRNGVSDIVTRDRRSSTLMSAKEFGQLCSNIPPYEAESL
ncbi:hypothetical protein A4X06_0g3225 [Tilletia controversa]|uniref:Uncharacterized protein n=1 Tax=Tilletia controversa TaxID=13291 RepID=A0A8X7MUV5_9BASI|nr:hypothetical protein A4X06_0g3225 [Tilletia controversa]